MGVGYQPSQTEINNMAGQLAVGWRDLSRRTHDFWARIVAMGADDTSRAAALGQLGFAPSDATQMVYLANVLNTLAAIYYGDAGQTPPFSFDSALSGLWGTR